MQSPGLPPQPVTRSPKRLRRWAVSRQVNTGLTLVELVVTLTILVLASGMVVPSFLRFQHASQLQWSARRILALAGEARGLAVSGDTIVRLGYDHTAHGMRMVVEPPEEGAEDAPAAPGKEPPVNERRTPDTRLLPMPWEVAVKVERDRPSEDQSLRFYPDGRSDAVRLRLDREGFQPIVLAMNARTGRLRIQESPQ